MSKASGLDRRSFLRTLGTGGAAVAASACRGSRAGGPAARGSAPAVPRAAVRESWETDVLVVGGGPAGIGAALGAVRRGVRTALVENHGFFGGVAAWSLGMPINQVRPKGKPRSEVHELLISSLRAYGPQAFASKDHQLWCNVDYLKPAVADAFDRAGVRYLLHARAADAVVEGGRVTGVIVAGKGGLALVRARAVVDATGDADVAAFAGAETMKETGALSPMTLLLKVSNVDIARAQAVDMAAVAAAARAKYPLIPPKWRLEDRDPSSDTMYINHSGNRDARNYDGSDPADLTAAEVFARRQAVQMVEAMREFGGEALRTIELVGTSPQVAVRETRRVKGLYVLTEEDALEGRTFPDAVAWRSGFLDIGYTRFSEMKIHDVPYRSLVPERVDGLLVAGRCISATHAAASAGKSMGNCMATGHAAGVAAALCAKGGLVPRALDAAEVRAALRADGVDLTMGGQGQEGLELLG